MSLDVCLSLPVDSGNPEIVTIDVYESNITHNLGKMAVQLDIYNLLWYPVNLRARDLVFPLLRSIEELNDRKEYYNEFNASNGWGTREQFLEWLKELLKNCQQYPNAIFSSSR